MGTSVSEMTNPLMQTFQARLDENAAGPNDTQEF